MELGAESDMIIDAQQEIDSAAPAQRRKEPRYPLDSRAILHLVSIGSKFAGRIINLSLHGCCLQTDEAFPLGIYRRVETEFQLQGVPVRLAGVTQSVHDRRTIGIRFLGVSPRKLDQLRHLIAEIEATCSPTHEADTARS